MSTAARRNITLSIPVDTLRQVRILAAEQGISVTRLLSETLVDIVRKNARYERSMRIAFEYLDRGFPIGGKGYKKREELHDRARLRRQ